MRHSADFDAMNRPGVAHIRALLHDSMGRFITERQVVAAPDFIDHDGRRYELADEEDAYARYFEATRRR